MEVACTLQLAVLGVEGEEALPLSEVQHGPIQAWNGHWKGLGQVVVGASRQRSQIPNLHGRIKEAAGLQGVCAVQR